MDEKRTLKEKVGIFNHLSSHGDAAPAPEPWSIMIKMPEDGLDENKFLVFNHRTLSLFNINISTKTIVKIKDKEYISFVLSRDRLIKIIREKGNINEKDRAADIPWLPSSISESNIVKYALKETSKMFYYFGPSTNNESNDSDKYQGFYQYTDGVLSRLRNEGGQRRTRKTRKRRATRRSVKR